MAKNGADLKGSRVQQTYAVFADAMNVRIEKEPAPFVRNTLKLQLEKFKKGLNEKVKDLLFHIDESPELLSAFTDLLFADWRQDALSLAVDIASKECEGRKALLLAAVESKSSCNVSFAININGLSVIKVDVLAEKVRPLLGMGQQEPQEMIDNVQDEFQKEVATLLHNGDLEAKFLLERIMASKNVQELKGIAADERVLRCVRHSAMLRLKWLGAYLGAES